MLDEAEFAVVSKLYSEAFRTKDSLEPGHPGRGLTTAERFSPVCDAYKEMTGFAETNANAVMHHRISLCGPICRACGRPFRTPKASFCASCGDRA
jgi:hypothetical protein